MTIMATEDVPVVEHDLPPTELPEEAVQAAAVPEEAGQGAAVPEEADQPAAVVEQPKDDQTAEESTEPEAPLEGDAGNPPEGTGESG